LGDATVAVLFRRALGALAHVAIVRGLGLYVSAKGSIAIDDAYEMTPELVREVGPLLVTVLTNLSRATAGALTDALHAALLDTTDDGNATRAA
jgi:hypothetical protein